MGLKENGLNISHQNSYTMSRFFLSLFVRIRQKSWRSFVHVISSQAL